jgi:hypothetical protein
MGTGLTYCDGCRKLIQFWHMKLTHCDICDEKHRLCKECYAIPDVAVYGPWKGGNPGYSQCPMPLLGPQGKE